MTWDTGAFERLRASRGGPQFVPLIAGMPDILVDVSGLADLMARGRIGNPVLQAVLAEQAQIQQEQADGTAPAAGSPEFWDRHRRMLEWQDELIGAIVLEPPWCPMAELPSNGSRPPAAICIYDLTPAERSQAIGLVYQGVDALETFRPERRSPDVGSDGGDVSSPPEQLVPVDPAGAPLTVLARQGHLAASATPPEPRKRRHAS